MNLCINVCMVYEVLNVPIDIDSCKPNPCPNGAICKNDEGSYSCLCPEGFEGDACEGRGGFMGGRDVICNNLLIF